MVLETLGGEFHVALWRVGEEKLGLRLAVADNTLRINAITGSRIEEMNRRCRTCCVKQILDQQLLEKDRVVSVNGKTELAQMFAELSNLKVKCCHLRVRRHPEEGRFPVQCSVPAAVPRAGYHGMPMQTSKGTPVPVTLQGALQMQSDEFFDTASVLTVKGIEQFSATSQAVAAALVAPAAGPPRMCQTGLWHDFGTSGSAGSLSREQQHQQAVSTSGASASCIAAVPAPRGPSQVRVIKNYDPPSELENGYLGVVEGTMVTVQPGSRAAPEARNRFQCEYVFAWKTNEIQSRGWLPVDILDSLLA